MVRPRLSLLHFRENVPGNIMFAYHQAPCVLGAFYFKDAFAPSGKKSNQSNSKRVGNCSSASFPPSYSLLPRGWRGDTRFQRLGHVKRL